MSLIRTACLLACSLVLALPAGARQQVADPDFKPTVVQPAYAANGPVVAIDEAHDNFHTAEGRYAPFADLLKTDGFRVRPSRERFTAAALRGADILVVANAGVAHGPDGEPLAAEAFTRAEADALAAWVRDGGALLLIADHAPFGDVAAPLAERFGVAMGRGWAFAPTADGKSVVTQFVFTRGDGRLGDHPILRGRGGGEAIGSVRAFTGQSLSVPPGATNLLRLDPRTREAADNAALNAAAQSVARGETPMARDVVGLSQGLAMTFGKGRVVVLGEAAMFSAQVITLPPPEARTFKVGMNVPGYDNQQFALNVVRWLAGALD